MSILKHQRRRRRSVGEIAFESCNILLFLILTFFCFYPFYYLIINSISANNLSAAGEIYIIPREIHFINYRDILKLPGLGKAAFISIARTVLGSGCTVLASAFLGYLFSKKNFWHRRFFYRFVISTMYFNAGLIPVFMNMHMLHLTDNFLVYILPAIVSPFNIILVKTYIESTPISLQEAAQIDGAGPFRVFTRVIFPVIMPIVATILIFSAVGQWNSFQDTLLYMTDDDLFTLQYILHRYISQANMLASLIQESQNADAAADLMRQMNPTSVNMTVSVVVILPILFVYPFLQRYIVKGIMLGAIKG